LEFQPGLEAFHLNLERPEEEVMSWFTANWNFGLLAQVTIRDIL
jgi:hypothetical protein